eukprot:TRINITY_DN12458_c0_g1_i1.p1 TRINITY_DN12458_c0_g1~~TRINITY_DN12458_c0_g1_i1.p1  ORF type:complete len:481 (+),score=100.75 TRINITY_DN12458_c0_g1_i1:114-1556(+)
MAPEARVADLAPRPMLPVPLRSSSSPTTHCTSLTMDKSPFVGGPEWAGAEESTELLDYARQLGLDPVADLDLMWLAEEALATPLPQGWSMFHTQDNQPYFFNEITQDSCWFHPVDSCYKELVDLVLAVRSESPPAPLLRRAVAAQEHLLLAQRTAEQQLRGWCGPFFDENGEAYYHNEELDLSTWQCPLQELHKDLATRERVLRRCLFDEWPEALPRQSADAGEGYSRLQPASLHVAEFGWEGGRRENPASPSSVRSFHTACSGRSPTRSPKSYTGGCTRSSWTSRRTMTVRSGTRPVSPPAPPSPTFAGLRSEKQAAAAAAERDASSTEALKAKKVKEEPETSRTLSSPALEPDQEPECCLDFDLERTILAFVGDAGCTSLELPPALNAEQRKRAKAIAEKHAGLRCESFGFGADRRLHLFKEGGKGCAPSMAPAADKKGALDEFTFGHSDTLDLPPLAAAIAARQATQQAAGGIPCLD